MIRLNTGFYLLLFLACNAVFPLQLISRDAPITTAGSKISCTNSMVTIPISVTNFTQVTAISLRLDFDPTYMTYIGDDSLNILLAGFTTNEISVSTNLHKLYLVWSDPSPVTLANGAKLLNLKFTYLSGTSILAFNNTFNEGGDCEYGDEYGDPMNDNPTASFYFNATITAPAANFMANTLTPPKNVTVHFTDQSTGSPVAWSWSFDRSTVEYQDGTDSHSQNPRVQFTDGGLYSVTLLVNYPDCSSSNLKTGYLRAGIAGLWTGITSTGWDTPSNWDNYLGPDGSTDVVIPPSAPNWPVFDGDLTLGTHCHNLTLSGANSSMIVTGSIVIHP